MKRPAICLGLILLAVSIGYGQQKTGSPKTSIEAGKKVYIQYCVSCHLPDGLGVPNMNPTLSKTSYVKGDQKVLIGVLLNGLSKQEIDGETYNNIMPSFDYLTDKEMADVLTYVRNSFGNKSKAVMEGDVKTVRASVKK